jgi:alcohol dehydrogenase class IV
MENFSYYQPTKIKFGCGRVNEVGKVAAKYGKRCLLVTVPVFDAIKPAVEKVKASIKAAELEVAHFDGVIPNPTTESITAGAEAAKSHNADVVVGLGGGSSMDSAKAIAVEATHEGTSWDYRWCSETQPTEKTLPVIAVTTTSGTGSQVTQVAVITNTKECDKSAIYNPMVYPKVAIVDAKLMMTVPEHITASTGFDVFCHAFEAWIHSNTSPFVILMAKEAVKLVTGNLPTTVKNGLNLQTREAMAWADTLAGHCIANAGVTLPHGMSMAIGGMYPHVMHAEALAVIYPEFMRYTYGSAIEQFAVLGRIFDSSLESESDEVAAERSCEEVDKFLKEIGMWLSLETLKVPKDELPALAKQCTVLPDYKANPKVVTLDDVSDILNKAFRR